MGWSYSDQIYFFLSFSFFVGYRYGHTPLDTRTYRRILAHTPGILAHGL